MLQNTKIRLLFSLGILIGSIGAIGQAYLLYHALANSYPYKMMDYLFYNSIANIGIYLAPFIAIISGFLAGRKKLWLTPITPVFLCPLIFAAIYKTAAFFGEMNDTFDNSLTFDGETSVSVAQKFFVYSISLSVIGLAVGAICSYLLFRFSKQNKLS